MIYTIEQHYSLVVSEAEKLFSEPDDTKIGACIRYPHEDTGNEWLRVWITNRGEGLFVDIYEDNKEVVRKKMDLVPVPEDLRSRIMVKMILDQTTEIITCIMHMNFANAHMAAIRKVNTLKQKNKELLELLNNCGHRPDPQD